MPPELIEYGEVYGPPHTPPEFVNVLRPGWIAGALHLSLFKSLIDQIAQHRVDDVVHIVKFFHMHGIEG